jgi:hypothetical protein
MVCPVSTMEYRSQSHMSNPALERHYTVFELAEIWNVSYNTAKKLVENEPDILRFGSDETRYGRKRVSLEFPKAL